VSQKPTKGIFLHFFQKKPHTQNPLLFRASEAPSLLKTVFYKKHPIDENNKWSYHYLTTYPLSSLIFGLWELLKNEAKP
jgi:hypothetical protein